MSILVVIPTYNEKENLEPLVERLLKLSGIKVNILIVDDASPDGTGEIARTLARHHYGRVSVLHREKKSGLGSAYLDGFSWALKRGYDIICQMDADGSHDPDDLSRLIKEVEGGADIAIGSRRVKGGRIEGWNAYRHLMSMMAAMMTRQALGLKTMDVTAGFRCLSRRAVELLIHSEIEAMGYAFQEESLAVLERAGMTVREVPVTFRDRTAGSSKLDLSEVRGFLRMIWRLVRK
ncbi:MAG: polyprenol monophosphomannose synthase [Patescibacteria group bacterium]|nr:polyprenol monophosphomannose synthase [Patescibacteria group bacterium]